MFIFQFIRERYIPLMPFDHITFSEYVNIWQELIMVVNDAVVEIQKVFWENLNGNLYRTVNKHSKRNV